MALRPLLISNIAAQVMHIGGGALALTLVVMTLTMALSLVMMGLGPMRMRVRVLPWFGGILAAYTV